MKSIITLFVLFIAIEATAQDKIPMNFLGIPWSASIDSAEQILKKSKKVSLISKDSSEPTKIKFVYKGKEYAGISDPEYHIWGNSDSIYMVFVLYENNSPRRPGILVFLKIWTQIANAYGFEARATDSKHSIMDYISTHVDNELYDYMTNRKEVKTTWELVNGNKGVLINLTLDKENKVLLTFNHVGFE